MFKPRHTWPYTMHIATYLHKSLMSGSAGSNSFALPGLCLHTITARQFSLFSMPDKDTSGWQFAFKHSYGHCYRPCVVRSDIILSFLTRFSIVVIKRTDSPVSSNDLLHSRHCTWKFAVLSLLEEKLSQQVGSRRNRKRQCSVIRHDSSKKALLNLYGVLQIPYRLLEMTP